MIRLEFRVLFAYLLVVTISSAQEPALYYKDAAGKQGFELKAALNTIISANKEFPYTSGNIDTWDILKESDQDPDNPENVILVYTHRSVNADQEYNGGSGWSREHVWAKSRGDFGTTIGTGTDLHNLKPADVSVNSTRSNRSFFESSAEVFDNGVFTGCYVGDGFTFEPRDDVKGDIARIIFYMATRYEGYNGDPDLELTEEILSSDDKSSLHGVLKDLLQWHQEDPVDDFERSRNNVIYNYQGNRNPFVDHPEWVDEIWAVSTAVPNPSKTIVISMDEPVHICNLVGQTIFKGRATEFLDNLELSENTLYIVSNGGKGKLVNGGILRQMSMIE